MFNIPFILTNTPSAQSHLGMIQDASHGCLVNHRGRTMPAVRLKRLYVGDVFTTPNGGTMTFALKSDGRRWKTRGRCRIRIERNAVKLLSGTALRSLPPVPFPLSGSKSPGNLWIRGGGVTVRSLEDEGGPYGIRPSGILLSAPTTLYWQGHFQGNASIRFVDGRSKTEFTVRADSGWVALPKGMLKPGQYYRWGVVADDGKMDQTWIRVASDLERREVAPLFQAERTDDPSVLSLVGYGYELRGLHEDARRIYARLAHRLPKDEGIRLALSRIDQILMTGQDSED